jgi:DNA-binding response OmpR family regulator
VKQTYELVLVVDDEPYAREIVSLALSVAGFHVMTAGNGTSGLDVVLNERPRLVLTDIHMPDMDGDRLAEAILERLPDDPPVIIGFSADPDAVQRVRANPLFAEVLRKPLAPRELIDAVMRHLDGDPPAIDRDRAL